MTRYYKFSVETGELVGFIDSEKRYPANHLSLTAIEPPEAQEGHARVFDREAQEWKQVEDHRGKKAYDKETKREVELKAPGLPDNLTLDKPSEFDFWDGEKWSEDEEAKAASLNEAINAERDRRISLGATVSLTSGKSFTVQMRDQRDWRNTNGLGSAGIARIIAGDNSTPVTFRDADNNEHSLTPPELVEMGLQVAARVDAIYNSSWAIKAMSPIPEDFTEDKYWQ